MPQLAHVTSCGWWRDDGRSIQGHFSTNHNLPHGQVPQVVAPELLLLFGLSKDFCFGGAACFLKQGGPNSILSQVLSILYLKKSLRNIKGARAPCRQGRSQGGRGRAAAPPSPPKEKPQSNKYQFLISISLLLILIKNPNLIFSFDRNSNLDQSNTSIQTIFLIL